MPSRGHLSRYILGHDGSFPNQQMAQFWSEDFAQRMVKVLYKAHKEDKHHSNENESDESDYSYEPGY